MLHQLKRNGLLFGALLLGCGAEPGDRSELAASEAPEHESDRSIGEPPAVPERAQATPVAAPLVQDEPARTDSPPRRCSPPAGISGSPRDVPQAVALMNSLPKPTSLACFLESLDRPLELYLTSSELSLQPAGGARSPRVFIVRAELVMSVVGNPEFSSLLEIGYQTSPGRSIKGEIAFPLRSDVTAASISERIRVGDVSICGGCHGAETRPTDGFFSEGAFESAIAAPLSPFEVTLDEARAEAAACKPTLEPERCGILTALFAHGEVRRSQLWDQR